MEPQTYGLRPALQIPVAVRSLAALNDIGESRLIGRNNNVFLLVPHAKTLNLSGIPQPHAARVRELHTDAQVWVRPEYTGYRRAYSRAADVLRGWKPQARLTPRGSNDLDHVLHRVAARHFQYFLVRLFPLAPGINQQYGRTWERFLSGTGPSDSGGYLDPDTGASTEILLADPIEISKVLERAVPTGGTERTILIPARPPYEQWYFER
jgi:hypothetical protein